jgi:hypothetical protein
LNAAVAGSILYSRNSLTLTGSLTAVATSGAAACARVRTNRPNMAVGLGALAPDVRAAVAPFVRTAPLEWDLFMIAGQSNGEGRGDWRIGENIAAGICKVWNGTAFVDTLVDPIGGASTGSAWTSFVNEYYQLTGRGVLLVEQATGGSALLAAAASSNNWSPTGALRAAAATAYEAAYANALANLKSVRKAGVLWAQGETDAKGITAGTDGVTAANYYAGLEGLITYFATQFDFGTNSLPFYIVQTGVENTGDPTGHQQVRAQQAKLARYYPNARLAHFSTVNFQTRGLMIDLDHYSQAGLIEIGRAVAEVAAAAR